MKTLLYRLLVELFSLLFTEIFLGELEWRLLIFLFKKIAKLLVLQQVIFPVTTLLHYFCSLVQGLLLVCIHDGSLLFKTEIAPSRLFVVDWGLPDDFPLGVKLDPLALQLPDVGR